VGIASNLVLAMRERILGAVVGCAVLAGAPGWGQMHKVTAPQQVVRAVGVYEWTGDMAKPKASRLIPVSLYINGEYQDAGEYLARPVPFALDTGNVYELKNAGIDKGTVDLDYARHVQDANHDFEDSWYGYGSFHAAVAERPKIAKKLAPARTSGINSSVADSDSDRPTLVRKHGSESGSGSSSTSSAGTAPSSTTPSSGSVPADDPDRPTMHRASGSEGDSSTASSGTASASTSNASTAPSSTTASSGNVPADDPDRPTLKRRSPTEAKRAKEEAEVSGTGVDPALNNDPNRPRLHYGKPGASAAENEPSRLVGLPVDLHQMVAVSDAVDRDPHNFARNWEDAAERAAILEKMQTLARAQLAQYDAGPAAAPTAAAKKKTVASKARRKKVAAAPAPVALMDEVLKGYTLSYGGDPTYVYMAHTAGTGAALRYVTVVAQSDEQGELKAAIQSVTDAAHLDRTAQMKFVDVVDVDATNRASLLFELRAQSTRQFALYRVIAGQAQQFFVSGATE
jgi:hypothetical protein